MLDAPARPGMDILTLLRGPDGIAPDPRTRPFLGPVGRAEGAAVLGGGLYGNDPRGAVGALYVLGENEFAAVGDDVWTAEVEPIDDEGDDVEA